MTQHIFLPQNHFAQNFFVQIFFTRNIFDHQFLHQTFFWTNKGRLLEISNKALTPLPLPPYLKKNIKDKNDLQATKQILHDMMGYFVTTQTQPQQNINLTQLRWVWHDYCCSYHTTTAPPGTLLPSQGASDQPFMLLYNSVTSLKLQSNSTSLTSDTNQRVFQEP